MPRDEKLFEFAEYVIQRQNLTLESNENFQVALDIRKDDEFFTLRVIERTLLNNESNFKRVNWSKWKIYFVSETLTSLDSSNSHYHQFKKRILDPMVHKYGHLNLGPTVVTINENLLDPMDNKHVEENHLIEEYIELLPPSFDLMIVSPYIELDMLSDARVVGHDSDEIYLNVPIFQNAERIIFLINDIEDARLFEPESNFKLITNKYTSKVTTFLISKIHNA